MSAPARAPRRDVARNHDALVRAAITAVHREGPQVPLATIAADAGVGIGTLYRHFPSREDLLEHLTHRSFELVLDHVRAAAQEPTAAAGLRAFVLAAVERRNELVLPLHGGPPVRGSATQRVRRQVHQAIQRLIDRGADDGTVRRAVTPREVVVFGAVLAQPRPSDRGWDDVCRRLVDTWVAGLGRSPS